METTAISDSVLTNAGERMIVGNTWGYWAHLSIYHFALPFARGRRVLDAGSGAGYGAAYLAGHGAKVLALDAGAVAIEHSRSRYAGDLVRFEVADLNAPLAQDTGVFDLVFSSNVFEHVGNVDGLAAECARVMAADGVTVVAVPPVCSAEMALSDMDNPFHVHHLPPTAWEAKLRRFFLDVRCHAHLGAGEFAADARTRHEIALPPDRVTIRETDFAFPGTSAQALQDGGSITAIYVCRGRRDPAGPESVAERCPAAWQEGALAAGLIGRLKTECEELTSKLAKAEAAAAAANARAAAAEADGAAAANARAATAEADGVEARALIERSRQLAARVEALETSTVWRVSAPARAIMQALRRP